VEEHALGEGLFRGAIPAGQYGAGTVSIWDQGTYDNVLADKPVPQTMTEGIQTGHLEFALHGEKLQGRFALIRMRRTGPDKEHWLLIKMQDAWARPAGHAAVNARQHGGVHTGQPSSRTSAGRHAPTAARARHTTRPPEAGVAYTHTDKLIYPEAGITKGDVLDFYRRMATRLLPYL